MYYGEESVYDYLSDVDKQALGITEETIQNNIDINNLDISSMIQNNRGFISAKELRQALNEMDDDTNTQHQYINPLTKADPYQMKLYMEMQQAQRESDAFNQRMNLGSSYRNMDYDDSDYGISDDFFRELND